MALLIVREEVVCMVVFIFLISYKHFYHDKKVEDDFMKIALLALAHVVFDMITVITVNKIDDVPPMINKVLHMIYYYFSLLFIMEFYNYVVKLTVAHSLVKKMRYIGYIPLSVFMILSYILPVEYVEGNGTNYSYGPLVFSGYGMFAVYCSVCLVLAISKRNTLDFRVRLAILPTTVMMVILVTIQAINPELLMTGAGVTIVCIGLFVTINNPVEAYIAQAYWDEASGVRNKNGFRKQLEHMNQKYANKQVRVGFIVGDMNGLKVINDRYGHEEGDKLIKAAASVMLANFKSAYQIYRIGGDEFAVIYISPDDNVVQQEIEKMRIACEKYKGSPIALSIAVGYASDIYVPESMDIYNKADELMYENKAEIKSKHPEFCAR